ncbi:DnaJ domain protein [Penicillium pulvis]|uniref:DnaJ domain protein n=1 Tax=Penicillium pulvis TaxID=1562058 RepID=UPI002548CA98|nr:DnaJ domain protein [Penicillium pulvis]KAJ5802685.1 DnaJ domain protein [Penicillium pulvis]
MSQSADSAEIRSAYKKIALVKHPDRQIHVPNAKAEFQLLKEAYDHLYDPDMRQEYNKLYQSTILPGRIKDQKIAGLKKQLRQQVYKRREAEFVLANAKKDLIRLHAERDSKKGEKERMMRDRATEETWFLNSWINYFFLPGKAAKIAQRKQQQESDINTLIGQQRTKEKSIYLKLKGNENFTARINSAYAAESKIEADIRKIEEDWLEMIKRQEMERLLAERREKSRQAYWTWSSTQTNSTGANSYFHQSNASEF